MTADYAMRASEETYTRILRDWLLAHPGVRASADWEQLRDRRGTSSIDELIRTAAKREEANERSKMATLQATKRAPGRARIARQRQALGKKPPVPTTRRKSVRGRRVSDFPEVARQWHTERNGSVRPEDVPAGTTTAYSWICEQDQRHQWKAQTGSRCRGSGCPFCSGLRVLPEESFAAMFPDIAAEWHPKKNDRSPFTYAPSSSADVWWQCPEIELHVYQARINSRTLSQTDCRACAGKGRPRKDSMKDKPADVVAIDDAGDPVTDKRRAG